ncbi:MAG: hypothetical protein WD512_13935 [Candidatus Paceibacterota bacterium]
MINKYIIMNFEFSESMCGFQTTDGGNLSRVKYQDQPVLLCQYTASNDQVGIYRNIELPNQAQYQIKITGLANNDRTYIKVTTKDGLNLLDTDKNEKTYFKRNEQETISMKFYSKVTNIKLSILMGGDSIVLRGNSFMIFQIRIIPIINQNNEKVSSNESSLKITRIFETVAQLELEKQDPLRSNQTPMEPGEYAILKESANPHPNSNPNVSNYEDLYILSNNGGLKYVSRIGTGRPFNFGEPVHMVPGKEIPVYSDNKTAQEALDSNPNNFYTPHNEYHYDSNNNNSNDIYMYLDTEGYVRWLRYKN